MKKILFLITLAAIQMDTYGAVTLISSKHKNTIVPWELNSHARYHEVQNQLDENLSMRAIVNKYVEFNGAYVTADPVTFSCNGEEKLLKPGIWTSCQIKPGKGAYVVYKQNFIHGAQGVFDVDFDYE